jgi:hypothetical protein
MLFAGCAERFRARPSSFVLVLEGQPEDENEGRGRRTNVIPSVAAVVRCVLLGSMIENLKEPRTSQKSQPDSGAERGRYWARPEVNVLASGSVGWGGFSRCQGVVCS